VHLNPLENFKACGLNVSSHEGVTMGSGRLPWWVVRNPLLFFTKEPEPVTAVACGDNHTIVLSGVGGGRGVEIQPYAVPSHPWVY